MTLEKFMMKPPYARPINLMKSLKKSGQAPPLPFLLPVLCEPCICLFALKKNTIFLKNSHVFLQVELDYYMLFSDRNLFRLAVCRNLQKCNFFAWNVSNESKCMLPFFECCPKFFCKLINYAHKKFPSKFIHWLDTNPLSNWIAKKDWKMFTFKHNFFLVFW